MGLFKRFKKKETIDNMDNIFNNLPDFYKTFLENNPNGSEKSYNVHKEEDPDFDGRYWNLFGKTELLESWEMNGVGIAKNFECLKLYIKLQKEYGVGEYTTSNIGRVSITRVESGFVIGTENGDYLYLDKSDNYSVWIYYHDGGDVLKITDSFEAFISS